MTKAYQLNPAGCGNKLTFDEFEEICPKIFDLMWAEEKLDGQRFLLQVRPNGANINYLTSRRTSVVTKEKVEKQDKLPNMRDWAFPKDWEDSVFDGELVHPDGGTSNETATAVAQGIAVYHVFDVIRFSGKNFSAKTQIERRALLRNIRASFPKWMRLVPYSGDPRRLLRSIREQGGEGIILKEMNTPYGQGWTKVCSLELHDVVVVGFEMSKEGKYANNKWIKGVKVGQWRILKPGENCPIGCTAVRKNKGDKGIWALVSVGQVSGFTEELRQHISENQSKYKGRAMEIKAKQRFGSGLFRSPRFNRWRDDKDPKDCKYDQK